MQSGAFINSQYQLSRSNVSVTLDIHVGNVNATRGVHVAARVDSAGCWTFKARGVFVFLHYDTNTYQLTTDLGEFFKSKVMFVI